MVSTRKFFKKKHGYVSLPKGVIHVSFWTNTFPRCCPSWRKGSDCKPTSDVALLLVLPMRDWWLMTTSSPGGSRSQTPHKSPGQTGWPVPELAYQSPSKCNPQPEKHVKLQMLCGKQFSALAAVVLSRSIPTCFQKCAASMPRRARRQWHAQCRIRWSLWCGNSLPPKGAQESLEKILGSAKVHLAAERNLRAPPKLALGGCP